MSDEEEERTRVLCRGAVEAVRGGSRARGRRGEPGRQATGIAKQETGRDEDKQRLKETERDRKRQIVSFRGSTM